MNFINNSISNKIPYVNLSAQWEDEKKDLLPIIESVLKSGEYILGDEVEKFELLAAKYFGVKHCVGLNSGTDALLLGLSAIGIKTGDEVITTSNSFIASTAAIVHLGAIPIFVDVKNDQNIDPDKIKDAITSKTKAIMPVHLTGRMSEMDTIKRMAKDYNLKVIEDAAQSAGSKYQNICSGAWGDIGCFSAHPLKNLNACGDAGFITTNHSDISQTIKLMANHGLKDRDTVDNFGLNSRMDALQAAILNYRIKQLPSIVDKRRKNAKIYQELLDRDHVFFSNDSEAEFNTFHTFVIQVDQRDSLKEYLNNQGIETAIHYPVPIHLQPASKHYNFGTYPNTEEQARRILTLPIHQYLDEEQLTRTATEINYFFKR